jgi:hypothetical protein
MNSNPARATRRPDLHVVEPPPRRHADSVRHLRLVEPVDEPSRVLHPDVLSSLAEYRLVGGLRGLEAAMSMSPAHLASVVLAHQMRPSVGRTGVCWDNAVAESFWESLKRECLQGRMFATRAEARRAIFRWINWYNTTRLHTSLNSIPPIEWEQNYRQAS